MLSAVILFVLCLPSARVVNLPSSCFFRVGGWPLAAQGSITVSALRKSEETHVNISSRDLSWGVFSFCLGFLFLHLHPLQRHENPSPDKYTHELCHRSLQGTGKGCPCSISSYSYFHLKLSSWVLAWGLLCQGSESVCLWLSFPRLFVVMVLITVVGT